VRVKGFKRIPFNGQGKKILDLARKQLMGQKTKKKDHLYK
jgi:hypothetical protein